MTTPFVLIQDALWQMAERNPNLIGSLQKGNLVKYDDSLGAKRNISSADFPELRLSFEGWSLIGQNTSSTSVVGATYSWELDIGDLNLRDNFSPLTWELLRSMIDWDIYLCQLQWEGNSFVKQANAVVSSSGIDDIAEERGIRGWTSIATIEVECHFLTNSLRIQEQ